MQPDIPLLADASDHIRRTFEKNAILQQIPAGTELSREGDACHHFPIVKSGMVRVYKLSRQGQEVTLYRIREGESCILTLTCLMKTAMFPAHAEVEEDSEIWLVPADIFRRWTVEEDFWRDYVIGYLSRTLNNVIGLVEDMLFRRLELRIIDAMLEQTTESNPVLAVTHQEIANEVGSAREVVSRHLKELEREGLLSLARGQVRLLDRGALKKRSELL
ncbi:MAG: Crp/Fnr family transcriptional regulator [Bacteroidota bacterium]|nr:Crp/Fnr family transcriptional regulator [Bacteroidota bacterium]